MKLEKWTGLLKKYRYAALIVLARLYNLPALLADFLPEEGRICCVLTMFRLPIRVSARS